jgi:hypothetical protein
MALIALYHDNLVVLPWMTFVAYQILNLVTAGVVMFGNRLIPTLNKFSCTSAFFFTCVTQQLTGVSGLPAIGLVCYHGGRGCESPSSQ